MQWSDEVYRIFSHLPGELHPTGDWFVQKIYQEDKELLENLIREAVDKNKLFNVDIRIIRPDSAHCFINFVADRIRRDKAGNPEWMYGIIQDITHRKEIEKQADRRPEPGGSRTSIS